MPSPHAERPPYPLPGGDWSSVDAARAWLIAEEQRLNWTHREWARAYHNLHGSGSQVSGTRPEHSCVTKTKIDRFKQKGRYCIPDWLYWMPLAILRVEELGWHASDLDDEVVAWDEANIPGYLPEESDFDFGDVVTDDELAVLDAYRALDANEREVARFWLDHPKMLMWWGKIAIASEKDTEIKQALDFLLSKRFD